MSNIPPNTPLLDIDIRRIDGGGALIQMQFGALRLSSEVSAEQLLALIGALATTKHLGVSQVAAHAALPITGWFCPDIPSPTKHFSLTTEQLNPRRTI